MCRLKPAVKLLQLAEVIMADELVGCAKFVALGAGVVPAKIFQALVVVFDVQFIDGDAA